MKKYIFLLLVLLLITIVAVQVFFWYRETHQYYQEILSVWLHRRLMVFWLLWALVPVIVILRRKPVSFLYWWWSLVLWLYIFMVFLLSSLSALPWRWFLKVWFNTVVMWVILWYFLVTTTVLWWNIRSLWQKIQEQTVTSMFLDFGIWLFSFILILYVFAFTWIVSLITSLILFIALWALTFFSKTLLTQYKHLLLACHTNIVDFLYKSDRQWSKLYHILTKVLLRVVIFLFLRYLYNAYQMAFLPYPTAWDANHAYFFYPKMRALHWWIYWTEAAMSVVPRFREIFLMFWFSIGDWLSTITWIAPDTYALIMNMISWPLVILCITLAIHHLLELLWSNGKNLSHHFALLFGTLFSLSFFTSWMGAFLLFVDNKNDVWMLLFVLLWLIAWTIVLKKFLVDHSLIKSQIGFMILSWLFFAWWAIIKPTWMFDVMSFGLIFWWILFGILSSLWVILLAVWVLSYFKMMWIVDYVSQKDWIIASIIWIILFLSWSVWSFIKRRWKRLTNGFLLLLIWIGVIVSTMLVVKWTYYMIDAQLHTRDLSPKQYFQRIFLTQADDTSLDSQECSLDALWFDSVDELYDTTISAQYRAGFNEDFGRYVGFWRKWWFADNKNWPYFSRLARLLPEWCYWRWDSLILCRAYDDIVWFNINAIIWLQDKVEVWWTAYQHIDDIRTWFAQVADESVEDQMRFFRQQFIWLLTIAESDAIQIIHDEWEAIVYIPYKYLNIFNMTYNWSIQNSMSYYTDIWFQRLVVLFIVFLWLLYALFTQKRILTVLLWVALFSWLLRHLVASWIVWYNLWMIIWLIVWLSWLVYGILDENKDDDDASTYFLWPIIFVLLGLLLIQIIMNMLRIVSMVPRLWNTFLFYKSNWIRDTVHDTQMRRVPVVRWWYGHDDVFAAQFPHYRALIDIANQRWENEWIWIAWTYARYFIERQDHIRYEQMLTWIWELMSDNNVCKTYLRLLDQKKQYLVLDLNIWTVVQWEWNRSLFDRFFATVNPFTNQIESDWVISMMTRLIDAGYARLITTSNIWTYYAWTLPDSAFANIPEEQRILFRSRMASARYVNPNTDENTMIDTLVDIADQRVETWMFLDDIAMILWLDIRAALIRSMMSWGALQQEHIAQLTQDEKQVLEMYVFYNQRRSQDPIQYRAELRSFISRSVYSVSQIVVLELVR